jgi:hypothetical protein
VKRSEKQKGSGELSGGFSQGAGQLSLIEHALCPLAVRSNTAAGWVHQTQYPYTDKSGQRRTAQVRVISPLGLTPTDEFYLWGLLALTLAQPQPSPEFHATPHYCLRQLGVIDQHVRRGGRQYKQFAQVLERLSAVTYQNDGFYDPVRREHRRVAFGFLSYSLPLDLESSRAWRIVWDRVFLELAAAVGGHLRFDLELYRQLDPASRRLFLLVSKLFQRQRQTPRWAWRHLGEHVLGFAPTLATRDLKVKVQRCVRRLAEHRVVTLPRQSAAANEQYGRVVQLARGTYFDRRRTAQRKMPGADSPLADLMRQIGLDERAIGRCQRQFSSQLLQQWLDITLAARERHGELFFKKSAAAYFIDNVRNAAQNGRTPPDWWHDLVREERRVQAKRCRQEPNGGAGASSDDPDSALIAAFARQFQAAGQSAALATESARRFAAAARKQDTALDPALLLKIFS